MVRKRLIKYGVVGLAISVVSGVVWFLLMISAIPVPDSESRYNDEHATILKKVKGWGNVAVVFQYDIGAFGYSTCYVAIGETDLNDNIVASGCPDEIVWVKPSKLALKGETMSVLKKEHQGVALEIVREGRP